MKKLLLTAALAGALAAPIAPAAASDIPQPAGVKKCSAPYAGVIVWVNTQPTGYQEERFCVHEGPGAATAPTEDGTARAGVRNCQDRHAGYRGVYVWWYDLDNRYHETKTCIYVGP